MTQHEKFINRAKKLVQIAGSFNDDCVDIFDLEALKYFYDSMGELFSDIRHSLRLERSIY